LAFPYNAFLCNLFFINNKINNMKSIKMLMMAALTIFSVSVFAQDPGIHKMKMKKEKSM